MLNKYIKSIYNDKLHFNEDKFEVCAIRPIGEKSKKRFPLRLHSYS